MSITTDYIIDSLVCCSRCDRMLRPSLFQTHSDTGKVRGVCHECRINQINQWQVINREQTRTNQRRYNRTFRGRAIILLNAAMARAKQRSEEFTIQLEHVIEMLAVGVCQKTGVAFEYDNSVGGTQSPFAPSLDKIDASGIYELSNIQVVCFWYNAAKQQWPEHIVMDMCERVVRVKNARD